MENCAKTVIQNGFELGLNAGLGALTAVALTVPFGPAVGALCAVGGCLAGKPVTWILNKGCRNNCLGGISSVIAQIFTSAGVTLGITAALGVKMTFGAAIVFSLVSSGIAFALIILIGLVAGATMSARQGVRSSAESYHLL